MFAVARAAAIEAEEADIEASRVVDRIEALSTVFAVNRLVCAWSTQLWNMLAIGRKQ